MAEPSAAVSAAFPPALPLAAAEEVEERAEEERAVSVLEATERSERGEEQHASERRPPHSYATPSTEASSLKSLRDLTVHRGGAYST